MRDGDIVPAVVTAVDAAAIDARAGALTRRRSTRRASRGRARPRRRSWSSAAISIEARLTAVDRGRADRDRHARAAAGRRRRGARDRQPHRPDQGDGRRLQLRAQQVQPRDAGATARSARRSSRSSTPRRSIAATRRRPILMDAPVSFPPGAGQPPYSPHELRPQVRRPDHAAPRARAVAQRAGGPADGRSSARSR